MKFEVKKKKQKESIKKIKVTLYANGEIILPDNYKSNCKLSGPKLKPNKTKYIGIYINKNVYKEVPIKEINYRRLDPYFILRGADGQHGQKGSRKKERAKTEGVPVPWGDFLDNVLSHDQVRGVESDWVWFLLKQNLKDGLVYYTDTVTFNNTYGDGEGERHKKVNNFQLGNKNIENYDNGVDAYPSGNGGNGGNGGTLSLPNRIRFSAYADFSGGMPGTSELIKGGKKKKDSTVYHKNYLVIHNDIGTEKDIKAYQNKPIKEKNKAFRPLLKTLNPNIDVEFGNIKVMKSRDGKDAKGKEGKAGKKGSKIKVDEVDQLWLHQCVLESINQYCKDTFLSGDRRPAKWLLSIYLDYINNSDYSPKDFLTRNLINELNVINNKVNKNLDYFGNPVGWIPRLSALSNIDILKRSKSSIVKVLYYAQKLTFENEESENREKQLASLVEQLKEENKSALKELQDAYDSIQVVKDAMSEIDVKIIEYLGEIEKLNADIKIELKQQEAEKKAFKFLCDLGGAICQVIPYGQPFLGKIGGSIAGTISKIDIHSDNGLAEAFKTTGGIAKDIASFVDENKDSITKKINEGVDKEIKSAEGDIEKVEKKIQSHKADMEEYHKILGDEIGLFNSKLKIQKLPRFEQNFSDLDDLFFIDHIDDLESLKAQMNEMEGFSRNEKDRINNGITNLKTNKSDLVERLKEHKKTKKNQTKTIEKVGEVMEGVGNGIAKVSDGLVNILTPVDESSEEFKRKIEEISNKKYKKQFKDLSEKLDIFNAHKLKTVQELFKLEGIIESSCQTISSNLVKITEFNDQRSAAGQRQLNVLTKQFLNRVTQGTQELLLAQIYYLVRSYQYKFVRKIHTNLYDIPKLFADINKFFTDNGTKAPVEEDFEKAFDFVIQSEFLALALVLLTTRIQNLPAAQGTSYSINLREDSKTSDGVRILEELNTTKFIKEYDNEDKVINVRKVRNVKFQLHKLGVDSVGSGEDFYYRIKDIKFTNIKVSFTKDAMEKHKDLEDRISFKFGVSHSGESVIRAADGRYYYFTSKDPEKDDNIILNVKSWNAVYNGNKRNNENNGIENEKISSDDHEIVSKLLEKIGDNNTKLEYGEHLPGATSELTLSIYDNNIPIDFKITELEFDFYYEGISADYSGVRSSKQGNNGYLSEGIKENRERFQHIGQE